MRILVTGGAGFQGSHLCERWLRDGHEVTVLNTFSEQAKRNIEHIASQVTTVWGSVTDREVVEKTVRGQDVVAHLAAHINVDESIRGPRSFVEVNEEGTLNVLEAARENKARVIYASTCEVYGYAERSPVSESTELRPHSPYAASKAGADRMCFAFHKSYGMDVTILRPCNIYGKRQKWGRGGAVISIFAHRAAEGLPLKIFGAGSQFREYMNVTDLVEAYDLVLRRSDLAGETLNAGSGETPTIREIAEFIAGRTGTPILQEPGRPGEVQGFLLDSSRIRGLGFEPRVTFWKGLADYLDSVNLTKAVQT